MIIMYLSKNSRTDVSGRVELRKDLIIIIDANRINQCQALLFNEKQSKQITLLIRIFYFTNRIIIQFLFCKQQFKSMLESKVKVKRETVQVYEILKSEAFSPPKIGQIEDRKLIKQSMTVIYSTLVNYSAPITLKLSALLFLKKLFQTANPQVIFEAERIVPILMETAMSTLNQPDPGALYFVLNELRPVDEVELSKKYVRFSMQIIKQWAEYMIDLREQSSPYVSWFRSCQEQKAAFPPYFLHFTMKDYIEFMLNWSNRKRKSQLFQDKVDIYYFLTSADHYNKSLQYYRNNLAENSHIIVYETYSILISHSIPVQAKLQVLQSMKDLYQEGNLIYSSKVEDLIVPYFSYFVDLLCKNLPVDRYFEAIEHRLGVEPMDSRRYVYIIMQLIDQWNKYNLRSPANPFAALAEKISRTGLLKNVSAPLFQVNDINRYFERISIGKHREPQYIIPPPKKTSAEMEIEYRNKIQEYERRINDLMREQERYKAEIITYNKQGEERSNMLLQKVAEGFPKVVQNGTENVHQSIPQNVLQSIANNMAPNLQHSPSSQEYNKANQYNQQHHPYSIQSRPTFVEEIKYITKDSESYNKNMLVKEKHISEMILKSKMVNNQNENDYVVCSSKSLYRNNSQRRVAGGRDRIDDVSKIHKLSDAVKYKEFKKSRSRLNVGMY